MELTDEENQRVEAACSKVPHFAFLEGDAVPLSHTLFIANGTDLQIKQACAILFGEDGTVFYHFNMQELQQIKATGKVPIVVELQLQGQIDERGQSWWDWWVDELS